VATIDFQKLFLEKLNNQVQQYNICGVVTTDGVVYPLGSDTKVLSTIFELVTRPIIANIATENRLIYVEPSVQNHYPDFTLMENADDPKKIAIDVKTTYVDNLGDTFSYTLGGYTSFIRGNGKKNIVYPYSQYSEHWVVGYVYQRVAKKKAAGLQTFKIEDLPKISLPFDHVQVFVQKKWKISSDRAGSGNTTNIGSIRGTIDDFRNGNTPFRTEAEFLDYWRNYERTAAERKGKFSNITEFRRRHWIK